MAAHVRYESVRTADAEGDEHDTLKTNYADDDSSNDGDDSKFRLDEAPEIQYHLTRRSRALCACHRLSRTCIALCAATAVFVVLVLVSGGYLAYKSGLIDGQSPPWYPSPRGGTLSTWAASYSKAHKLISRMTLVEKVNITTGTGWAMDLCVGVTGEAAHVGFPALCLQDGPLGIRFADHADSFPAGITVGSTWNRELMRKRGEEHGREAKLKGVNVLLGPSMGPLGRNPAGGRNWEGFGSDPVLQAVAAAETIKGIQSQGVQATAKHYIGNEQEHFRKSFEWGLPESLSSNIDDRTLHEIYAWPFAEAVRSGVASVMCSYQMVNNSYACQNSWLLNGVLKDELGFQGYVQSDWLAQRSGVASALAGLDMSMPGDGRFWQDGNSLYGEQLTLAVLNGSVPMDRINDMAKRIVAAWYQVGQDSWESKGPNFSSWTNETVGRLHDAAADSDEMGVVNQYVETSTRNSRDVARRVAQEGAVVLKNEGSLLPLSYGLAELRLGRKAKVIVVGEDAGPGKGPNYCEDRACNQGTLASGWGSGATEFPYLVDPFLALQKSFNTTSVELSRALDNKLSKAVREKIKQQDLCLVFANADAGEGHLAWEGIRADRNDLELQKDGTRLIREVASLCGGPVVVVIHSVGPVIMEEFADLSAVKAILLANLPGQESGNALADVLFGRVDASGRLAYTIGRSLAEYGETTPVLYYPNHIVPQVDFKEGLYIDYRHFDKNNIEPRYEFGFGLSYTDFEYTNLTIEALKVKSSLPAPPPKGLSAPQYQNTPPAPASCLYPEGFRKLKKYIYPWIKDTSQVKQGKYPYPRGYDIARKPSQAGGGEGGNPSLFENHVRVTVDIKNTGSRTGKEVVQLYLSFPENISDPVSGEAVDMPVKVLRNFDKIELDVDESKSVEMFLTRKDLSYWSVVQQNWVMPEDDEFTVAVGRSSRDVRLRGIY
ncbi:hypothetical protein LTR70_006437 [Exophiala xenobiotica]|uniref:Probable beta-glucosidase E n=1 Tax=Lithohypha guttulata TaxID=1690604 RepID=A0ABR0K217_9EURO|nr:hypothetical protein LTR24_007709 [Lithohypha guttulata]KAK5315983.1 hypothetical protein LTR70_006437 [Exophiala xenobiotica]